MSARYSRKRARLDIGKSAPGDRVTRAHVVRQETWHELAAEAQVLLAFYLRGKAVSASSVASVTVSAALGNRGSRVSNPVLSASASMIYDPLFQPRPDATSESPFYGRVYTPHGKHDQFLSVNAQLDHELSN